MMRKSALVLAGLAVGPSGLVRPLAATAQTAPRPGDNPTCEWKGLKVMCGPRGLPLARNRQMSLDRIALLLHAYSIGTAFAWAIIGVAAMEVATLETEIFVISTMIGIVSVGGLITVYLPRAALHFMLIVAGGLVFGLLRSPQVFHPAFFACIFLYVAMLHHAFIRLATLIVHQVRDSARLAAARLRSESPQADSHPPRELRLPADEPELRGAPRFDRRSAGSTPDEQPHGGSPGLRVRGARLA